MKKLIPLLIMLTYLSGQDSKLKITILDLDGPGVNSSILKACFGRLESTLINSGRFQVIEKNKREELLKEAEWQNSGACDTDCAVEIGSQIGADYIVFGSITQLGRSFHQIDLKIVDIEEGEAVEAVTEDAKGDVEVLINVMEEASREIVRRIALGGIVTPFIGGPGKATIEKTYGNIDIVTDPPGANILIDAVDYGVTPKLVENLETGQRSLTLSYPGYKIASERIIIEDGKTNSFSKLMDPMTGNLTIISEPIGAKVFLNDINQGVTPLDLQNLIVKDYNITLELENYETVTNRISVQFEETITKKFDLEPKPGLISIITFPPNTDIKVGKQSYNSGDRGLKSLELNVGKYNIDFSAYGYETKSKSITITPNSKESININLKKLPDGVSSNPDMGFLTVQSFQNGLNAKISRIKNPISLPAKYFELKYGNYNAKVYKEGYESKKYPFNIVKQKTTELDVELKRKSKTKAIKKALTFPGYGQIYSGHKARSLVYSLSALSMAALLNNGMINYSEEKDLMDKYYSDYKTATTADGIDQTWNLYSSQADKVNDVKSQIIIYSGTLVLSWMAGVVDAMIFSGLK